MVTLVRLLVGLLVTIVFQSVDQTRPDQSSAGVWWWWWCCLLSARTCWGSTDWISWSLPAGSGVTGHCTAPLHHHLQSGHAQCQGEAAQLESGQAGGRPDHVAGEPGQVRHGHLSANLRPAITQTTRKALSHNIPLTVSQSWRWWR